MVITNKDSYLCIDEVGADICTGWYIGKNKETANLFVDVCGDKSAVLLNISRPDVVNAGLANTDTCGFLINFRPQLKFGEKFELCDANGEKLYEYQVESPLTSPSAQQYDLIELVEPFVELDIRKIQQQLMADKIYLQYRDMYRNILRSKSDINLRETIIDILADIKSTQHLLAAAYLDRLRYNDPNFTVQQFEYRLKPAEKLKIDMRGDITGTNWGEADSEGRWTSPDASTLLLPRLAPGDYCLELQILEESRDGARDLITLAADGTEIELNSNDSRCPYRLMGNFHIVRAERPFIVFTFSGLGSGNGEEYDKSRETSDICKIGSLTIERQVAVGDMNAA